MIEHEQGYDCGWWPPGSGEPGDEWLFEPARLGLDFDDGVVAVHLMTPAGPRALAAIPVTAIARVLAEGARFRMNGDATITVEVDVNGIDVPGLNAFVDWLAIGLASHMQQEVNPRPGCESRVLAVTWSPRPPA